MIFKKLPYTFPTVNNRSKNTSLRLSIVYQNSLHVLKIPHALLDFHRSWNASSIGHEWSISCQYICQWSCAIDHHPSYINIDQCLCVPPRLFFTCPCTPIVILISLIHQWLVFSTSQNWLFHPILYHTTWKLWHRSCV